MASGDQKDYRSPGEILREAREARGLSVEDVAESTKISPRMMQALEADEYKDIAGPIYARSFLRNLSRFFSLDEADMFERLESLDNEASRPQVPVHLSTDEAEMPTIPVPATPQPEPEAPATWRVETIDSTQVKHIQAGAGGGSRRLLWIVLLLVLAAATVTVIVLWGNGEDSESAPSSQRASEASPREFTTSVATVDTLSDDEDNALAEAELEEPAEALTPTTLPEDQPVDPPADTILASDREQASDQETEPVETHAAPAEQSGASNEDETSRVGLTQEETTPPDSDPGPELPAEDQGSTDAQPDPDAGALGSIVRPGVQPPVAGEMRLEIRALRRADLWVSADGESRQRRSLAAGEVIQFTARDHFTLELPEPDAVEVFVDGERRTVPPGLNSEWLVYPN